MQEQIEAELFLVLSEFSKHLPTEDVSNIRELIAVGEYAVAFEHLCAQLYEYDFSITPTAFKRLEAIGTLLEVDKQSWEILRGLIQQAH